MNNNQQLDLTLLEGYLVALDVTVIRQMLDLYIQQSKVYLTEISTALQQNDDKAWQEQCHKMKGSAASAGLLKVHSKLVAIEKLIAEVDIKSEHLQELTMLNEDAISAFKSWLTQQK